MSSTELDSSVCEILNICKCLEFYNYFKGITFEKFTKYTLEDLNKLLPGGNGHLAASNIIKYFQEKKKYDDEAGQNPLAPSTSAFHFVPNTQELIPTESTIPDEQQPENDGEDDYDAEEERMVFTSGQQVSKQVVEVSLSDSDDDEDDSQQQDLSPTPTTNEPLPQEPQASSSRYTLRQRRPTRSTRYESQTDEDLDDDESGPDEPTAKRVRSSGDSSTFFQLKNPRKVLNRLRRDPDFIDSLSHVQIIIPIEDDHIHLCHMDDPNEREAKLWHDFYTKVGPHIYSLELLVWTWRPLQSKCPYNLLKILSQYCPNLIELSLCTNGAQIDTTGKLPTGTKLKLTTLKIKHEDNLNYTTQLEGILQAAKNIESIKYSFNCLQDANFFLDTLQNLDKSHLKNFKSLSLRSYRKEGYLAQCQMVKLSKIEANLEQLELGNGLWEDIEGPTFEEFLSRFSKLKKLIIYGSFQGNSYNTPDILINIPPLPFLEYLSVGSNYEFASVFESFYDFPTVVTVEDDLKTNLFSVTLKLPLLPNLKSIVLGNLFKIDELHFSSLPSVTSFRVGSPWHLSVKFPPENSRKFCYPNVTELQYPDCLKDSSFVQNVAMRFPNLEKCWIFLPSVFVLRSFFKSMSNSKLEELYLKTQYDFETTMETCLLNRPALEASRSYSDFMKLEDLKAYKHWLEFVRFHNIELPIEKVSELEEDNFEGLAALKGLKILTMEHIPRTLRIPRGDYHWTGNKCQFTNSFIGFKKYPLSKKCLEQLPLQNLKRCTWPNFLVSCRDISKLMTKGFTDYKSDDDDVQWEGDEPGSSKRKMNKKGEKLKVQIQPAMLQADFKFHQKMEKK